MKREQLAYRVFIEPQQPIGLKTGFEPAFSCIPLRCKRSTIIVEAK